MKPATRWMIAAALASTLSQSVAAQEYSLFDRAHLSIGVGFTSISTTVRVDSRSLGIGSEVDFEKDMGLSSDEAIPEFAAEVRLGKRHVLGAAYRNIDRNASEQSATEIRFGDIVIPIDSLVFISFDANELKLSYDFFPLVRKRFALGIGIGVRAIDIAAHVSAEDLELSESAETAGPLPFLGIQIRAGLTRKLRLVIPVRYFEVQINEYAGSQVLASISLEHQTFRNFGLGARVAYSEIDIDVDDGVDYSGFFRSDLSTLSIYLRVKTAS